MRTDAEARLQKAPQLPRKGCSVFVQETLDSLHDAGKERLHSTHTAVAAGSRKACQRLSKHLHQHKTHAAATYANTAHAAYLASTYACRNSKHQVQHTSIAALANACRPADTVSDRSLQ